MRTFAQWIVSLAVLLALPAGCGAVPQVVKLAGGGDHRVLRTRPAGTPPSSPGKPPILYLALDGVGRDILYDLLRHGKMPNLAKLLGGEGREFPHAHFEEHMLSTMPSSTMAAWVTTMSGVGPAEHGVTGNEFFIREDRMLAAPAPVSFSAAAPTIQIYTEDYLDGLSSVPNVYERMREKDPDVLVWVAMHEVYRGSDKLLLAKKSVLAGAFEGFVEKAVEKSLSKKDSMRVYEELDEGAVESVVDELKAGPVPDVLTVYLSGTDLYAHVAVEGPDEARRSYLVEVVDPMLAKLAAALDSRQALAGRWIVVGADHGHTQVMHDDAHALGTKSTAGAPAVLASVGFRVRAFEQKVPIEDPFSAVLAYGGALAYVYLADRSSCPGKDDRCDWNAPPRYEEDVLAVAEAFHANDADGSIAPSMRGALDMILVRKPRPYREVDLPFEVYIGRNKTMPIDAWLGEHPHPTYVSVAARLRDLAVGVHGERAGDLLLVAHNGDRDRPEDRFYFALPYHSWHGSPSKQDSELPFIVASSTHRSAEIRAWLAHVLGEHPFQQKTADVLLGLRAGALDGADSSPR